MCGIHVLVEQTIITHGSAQRLVVADNGDTTDSSNNNTPEWLTRRGPDHTGQVVLLLLSESNNNDKKKNTRVTMQASVLQMRREMVEQPVPIISKESNSQQHQDAYLLWNGEVYQQISEKKQSLQDEERPIVNVWNSDHSDTTVVADLIRNVLRAAALESDESITNIQRRLAQSLGSLINAEFAMVLATREAIYYARDGFGRRSLLVSWHEDPSSDEDFVWQLASVADSNSKQKKLWKEVGPGKLHVYNVQSRETEAVAIEWHHTSTLRNIETPEAAMNTIRMDRDEKMLLASQTLEELLRQAVERRVHTCHQGVSILFSGGLDSAVLAALALQVLPTDQSLTLVNVCFKDSEKMTLNNNNNNSQQMEPTTVAADTLAARAAHEELIHLFPHHKINFVERCVDWKEVQSQMDHIHRLIHPKSSVMDDNIATALWFAAAACPNRVVLSGLGADEQMGGYGRHLKAWLRGGNDSLREELDMDLQRIWDRNLGRDDRVVSDTAKEARFPFLDPHVVHFLRELSLDCVCDFQLPPGEGDKRILRLVAARLGIFSASTAVKRAIQFGSRMSHVSDKRRFGSRRKATRLDSG